MTFSLRIINPINRYPAIPSIESILRCLQHKQPNECLVNGDICTELKLAWAQRKGTLTNDWLEKGYKQCIGVKELQITLGNINRP